MRDSPPPPSTFIHRHPPLLFIILSTTQRCSSIWGLCRRRSTVVRKNEYNSTVKGQIQNNPLWQLKLQPSHKDPNNSATINNNQQLTTIQSRRIIQTTIIKNTYRYIGNIRLHSNDHLHNNSINSTKCLPNAPMTILMVQAAIPQSQ